MIDFSEYFQKLKFPLVGVGVTAFNRVMPAFFVPAYRIVCHKNSREIKEIEKKCRVLAIERDCRGGIRFLNSFSILSHPEVQKYLCGLGKNLGIFVYKSTEKIANLCQKNGWRLIANPPEVRDPYENKKIFRETLEKIGVEPIPGEILKISDFNEKVFGKMREKYGEEIVLKLPEVRQGGGKGNTFVKSGKDLSRFWQKVKELGEIYKLENMIVEKKIEGISPSITGCVTCFGVLTGVVQTQITDIPEVVDVKKGGGMFVGHDWSWRHYPEEIQQQARKITQKFGEYLCQQGYKGIFGIDLIVEKGTNKVYPCECNPRFTGAFPVYSMIQLRQGEIPFDVFHLLELLGVDYRMNFEEVQKSYWQKKESSHIILSNKTENWLQVGGEIRAGVFRLANGDLEFVREGFSLLDIKDKEEFVLTDGVPFRGEIIKPNLRILKIIFPRQILAVDGKRIDKRTKKIVELVYEKLDLNPVEPPKEGMEVEVEF